MTLYCQFFGITLMCPEKDYKKVCRPRTIRKTPVKKGVFKITCLKKAGNGTILTSLHYTPEYFNIKSTRGKNCMKKCYKKHPRKFKGNKGKNVTKLIAKSCAKQCKKH